MVSPLPRRRLRCSRHIYIWDRSIGQVLLTTNRSWRSPPLLDPDGCHQGFWMRSGRGSPRREQQSVAIRRDEIDVGDDPGNRAVDVLHVLFVDAALFEAMPHVFVVEIDRFPAVAAKLPRLIDVEHIRLGHEPERFRTAGAADAAILF